MTKSLLIVESPAKAKTIKKYLGNNFEIKASMGHIIDLPNKRMGINLTSGNFEIEYEPITSKKKIIHEIKKASQKNDIIYLALDPDREGEAIAQHLSVIIKEYNKKNKKKIYRIKFNEITKSAIKKAIKNKTNINKNLFESQQARRILDRIVGYEICPILWKKIQKKLSAGRVQSIALLLLLNKEKKINQFIISKYWTVKILKSIKNNFIFNTKFIKNSKFLEKIKKEKEALFIKNILKNNISKITKITHKIYQKKNKPPFTTSKLQQEAIKTLGFSAKKTMNIAQSLYEGINLGRNGVTGLITYIRTDSTRVNKEILISAKKFIKQIYGNKYIIDSKNQSKNNTKIQNAHEAIRPISIKYNPFFIKNFLKKDEYKLYKIIWNRFITSQMKNSSYNKIQINITTKNMQLKTIQSIPTFDGFLIVYKTKNTLKNNSKKKDSILFNFKIGDNIKLSTININQHFTKPPTQFNEASLIKELEENGIGRPSTYTTILSTIQNKGYVEKKKKILHISELGLIVAKLLKKYFPTIMNVKFTALMEKKLDNIETGQEKKISILKNFYKSFHKNIENAKNNMLNIKKLEKKTNINCEKCNIYMIIKWGKNGSFIGCKNYPKCTNTKTYKKKNKKIIIIKKKQHEKKCKICNAEMILKKGRYGIFFGCIKYPNCFYTSSITVGIICPKKCGGNITIVKPYKKKEFYGCNNYPKCNFINKHKPLIKNCLICKNNYLIIKNKQYISKIECPICNFKINKFS